MTSSPITPRQIEGAKVKAVTDFIFLGSKITADGDCSCEIERRLLLGRKGKPGQQVKKQRHHFAHKGPQSQSYGFSSSCVQMWELDHTEDWALKNWCFWIVVLEKTPENPLDSRENKPVNPKGDQPWIFIWRTDAPIFWSPDTKSWLLEKTLMLGKTEGRRRRGQQRMRWLDGIPDSMNMNLRTLGDSGGLRSLAHCSPRGGKELDIT